MNAVTSFPATAGVPGLLPSAETATVSIPPAITDE